LFPSCFHLVSIVFHGALKYVYTDWNDFLFRRTNGKRKRNE
jgi:hypothetical protein